MNGQVELDEYLQVEFEEPMPSIERTFDTLIHFPDDVRHQVGKYLAFPLRSRCRARGDPHRTGTTPEADHRRPLGWWSVDYLNLSSL